MVALTMFRDDVISPSIEALDAKIEILRNSEHEVEQTFAAESYGDLRQSTIEGFLLTTQSIHERGLRELMLGMAGRKGWSKTKVSEIRTAPWSSDKRPSLQIIFEALFDAPIAWFGLHDDLSFLNLLCNALRHGDGSSAEQLHGIAPSLWMNWLPPGTKIGNLYTVPEDAPRHPALNTITLPRCVLDQMMMAVFAFWEDIEFVRCNSFSRRHSSAELHMDELRIKRSMRDESRVWSPA
ncbi:hypothetical protein XarbCFBP8150_00570 [Xanthomonas arboricola]|uniref:hypothetical protein n=1 Tax=Xanthomonas arboricola TaxID=56448 RepID=UPI000CEE0ECE|nr:hypothetical protein [Xanthomonas arboricola]PPT72986.1 hypothetical protein XarbCFBP8150_00570 [Xanthomonas arboricola]